MNPGRTSAKSLMVSILAILCSVAITIAAHAILPASVDGGLLDSALVMLWGFPIVAVSYFLILYTQCTVAVRYIGNRTKSSPWQTGIRFGLAFGLIYLLGMQEIMVDSSPFSTYGFEYIKYQFLMGIGDAIPVFMLCVAIALFTIKQVANQPMVSKINMKERLLAVSVIAVLFLIERTAGYETGIIQSSCATYTVPCYIWTALLGIVLGYIYTMLYPVLSGEEKWIHVPVRFSLIIGLNWIIFNSFIGLIMKGAMPDALLRSGLDVAALFIASCIIGRLIIPFKSHTSMMMHA
ncbi:MAG: hypothetical protein GXY34_05300 [Syntrophomonadaceae bacterium]|nr:hypothetical protein [Syntrophomonadaceae bacterium]